jgi:hypothetical protein
MFFLRVVMHVKVTRRTANHSGRSINNEDHQ